METADEWETRRSKDRERKRQKVEQEIEEQRMKRGTVKTQQWN